MAVDPYSFKSMPKWHPQRLIFTGWSRLADRYSRLRFETYNIPLVDQYGGGESVGEACWEDTQVTPQQAAYLVRALRSTEGLPGCIVEVGSWRGVTTRYLAEATKSSVIAIDPFLGPLNEVNLRSFEARTLGLSNVKLRRETFGQAVRTWSEGPARFVFIDAAHDYANVRHDLSAALDMTVRGGIIALHDTDDRQWAGCRRAVSEQLDHLEVIAHIPNLAVLRVREGVKPRATTPSAHREVSKSSN